MAVETKFILISVLYDTTTFNIMEAILKAFLRNDIVKNHIDIAKIKRLNRTAENQRISRFKKLIEVGQQIDAAKTFFESEQGQQIREDMGLNIKWKAFVDAIEIGAKYRTCQKQREAYLNSEHLDSFLSNSQAFAEEFDKEYTLAVEKFNKWCSLVSEGVDTYDATKLINGIKDETESEGGEGGEGGEGECTHTFVDKVNGVNFRIDNGQLITTCDKDDIVASLTELLTMVSEL